MAPRAYTLRKRADTAEATRRRIVDAAAAVYRDVGVQRATVSAVATRADVSRGTVLHHFGDLEGLLGAVLEVAIEEVRYPDVSIFEGAATTEDRLRRYVDAMVRFTARSQGWWEVFAQGMGTVPALRDAEAAFYEAVVTVQAAALGPLASDERLSRALGALVDFGTLGSLTRAGFDLEATIELLGDLVVDLARGRDRGGEGPSGRTG